SPGSASAAGTVPVAAVGATPVGHVSSEGTGGSGTGSGEVPRGHGSAEPAPEPARPERPGPPVPAPVREPDPPAARRMVGVSLCRKRGLLAGRYCPDTTDKQFVSSQQPEGRCDICKPPPPPAPEPEYTSRSVAAHDAKLLKEADPDVPEELAD